MPSPDILGQNRSYRRGMVLGLTMAEIFMLLLFCLMLAMALGLKRQDEKYKHIIIANNELRDRLAEAQAKVDALTPLLAAVKRGDDIFKEMEKAKAEVAKIRQELDTKTRLFDASLKAEEAVREVKQQTGMDLLDPNKRAELLAQADIIKSLEQHGVSGALKPEQAAKLQGDIKLASEVKRIIEERGRGREALSAEQVAKTFSDARQAAADRKNLQDQIKVLQKKLEGTGKGTEFPPCWPPQESGKAPDYIFDIRLTSTGVIVTDNAVPHRAEEQEKLRADGVISMIEFDRELNRSAFQAQTNALYRYSVSQNCRFFVRIYDETRKDEKEVFKAHKRWVEGPFYVYEVRS